MITAADLLRPVTPMSRRTTPYVEQRNMPAQRRGHSGIRTAVLAQLDNTPRTPAEIAQRLGMPRKRVNQELARITYLGRAVRVGRGMYRKMPD
jgi:predicted Rossmann fold nucleotide-binding protein DprA/Smf involved in DNA uptake